MAENTFDIEDVLGENEVRELLSDGQPHQATFIHKFFLDGVGAPGPFRGVVAHKTVTNYDEFDEFALSVFRTLETTTAEARQFVDTLALAAVGMALKALASSLKLIDRDDLDAFCIHVSRLVGALVDSDCESVADMDLACLGEETEASYNAIKRVTLAQLRELASRIAEKEADRG